MLDEDQETLAAEYVLGTLTAEEREHAEALLTFDSGFEAAVRPKRSGTNPQRHAMVIASMFWLTSRA